MQTQTPVLRIGPLANRFGVSPESLRVWERQGLIPQSHRTPGGHRRYGDEHVRALEHLLVCAKPAAPVILGGPETSEDWPITE